MESLVSVHSALFLHSHCDGGGGGEVAYFPVGTEKNKLRCDLPARKLLPFPCQEGRAGAAWQGKMRMLEGRCQHEVVFTYTRALCVISHRFNSAGADSHADTYLGFREVYLC